MKKVLMLLWMMFIITAMYGNSEKNEASGAHKLGDSPQATTYKATLAGYQGTFSNVDLSAYHGQEMQLTGVSCVKLDTGHAPNPFIVKNTSGDKYTVIYTVILDLNQVKKTSSATINFCASNIVAGGGFTLTVPGATPPPKPGTFGELKLIASAQPTPPANSTFNITIGSDIKPQITLNEVIKNVKTGTNLPLNITLNNCPKYIISSYNKNITISDNLTSKVDVTFKKSSTPTPTKTFGQLELIPIPKGAIPPASSTFYAQIGKQPARPVELNTVIKTVATGQNLKLIVTPNQCPNNYEIVGYKPTISIVNNETTKIEVIFKKTATPPPPPPPPPANEYITGTWLWGDWTKNKLNKDYGKYDYLMFGMITDLNRLKQGPVGGTGTEGPDQIPPKSLVSKFKGKCLWTYGGGGALPLKSPTTTALVTKIVSETVSNDWDGVDIDDEFEANLPNIVAVVKGLTAKNKLSNYTFGGDCKETNTPGFNDKITQTNQAGCDHYVAMCYWNEMWTETQMRTFIPRILDILINKHKINPKKIILAFHTTGITATKLGYLINWVKGESVPGVSPTNKQKLGGIFVWRHPLGSPLGISLMQQLEAGLGAKQTYN